MARSRRRSRSRKVGWANKLVIGRIAAIAAVVIAGTGGVFYQIGGWPGSSGGLNTPEGVTAQSDGVTIGNLGDTSKLSSNKPPLPDAQTGFPQTNPLQPVAGNSNPAGSSNPGFGNPTGNPGIQNDGWPTASTNANNNSLPSTTPDSNSADLTQTPAPTPGSFDGGAFAKKDNSATSPPEFKSPAPVPGATDRIEGKSNPFSIASSSNPIFAKGTNQTTPPSTDLGAATNPIAKGDSTPGTFPKTESTGLPPTGLPPTGAGQFGSGHSTANPDGQLAGGQPTGSQSIGVNTIGSAGGNSELRPSSTLPGTNFSHGSESPLPPAGLSTNLGGTNNLGSAQTQSTDPNGALTTPPSLAGSGALGSSSQGGTGSNLSDSTLPPGNFGSGSTIGSGQGSLPTSSTPGLASQTLGSPSSTLGHTPSEPSSLSPQPQFNSPPGNQTDPATNRMASSGALPPAGSLGSGGMQGGSQIGSAQGGTNTSLSPGIASKSTNTFNPQHQGPGNGFGGGTTQSPNNGSFTSNPSGGSSFQGTNQGESFARNNPTIQQRQPSSNLRQVDPSIGSTLGSDRNQSFGNPSKQGSPIQAAAYQPGGTTPGNTTPPIRRTANNVSSNLPGSALQNTPQSAALVLNKLAPRQIQVNVPTKFVLSVRNIGQTAANHVVVRDRIPRGTQLIQTNPKASRQNGDILEWDFASLGAGGEVRIEMELRPIQAGEIGSVAEVSFATVAGCKTKCTKPVLEVTHTGPPEVLLGQQFLMNITVRNTGDGPAKNVLISEILPPQLSHPSIANKNNRGIETLIGTILPNQSVTKQLSVRAQKVGQVRNTVRVTGDGQVSSQHSIGINIIAPRLVVAASGPNRRFLKRSVSHTFQVTNDGSAAASNIMMRVALPAGLKYQSSSPAGAYDPNGHVVYWRMNQLVSAGKQSVTVKTLPLQSGTQTLTFTALADRNQPQSIKKELLVEQLSELFFDIDDTENVIEIGSNTKYVVRIQNQGKQFDSNVTLVMAVPAGLEVVDVKAPVTYRVNKNPQNGQQIIEFQPIPKLNPRDQGQRVEVMMKGRIPGDHRVQAKISSQRWRNWVLKEHTTKVYADGS